MEKLVMEYTVLLNDSLPASNKFWKLEQRIKLDDLSDFSDELRNQVDGFFKKKNA